ncbi:MAG TPA: 6-hydroxymethylpterin diphosphokinase MptE-like protein [Planctomycetota bacterium]|nr:6-hydroxymethylpterin diphosphokinase MptE-like protein [Planctomycetota bacterium]
MSSHFERNLALLSRYDPRLAERLRAVPWPHPGVTVTTARNGAPTLKAVAHDGVEIRLHSEYDPQQEAAQFFKARAVEKHEAYVLNGFGLGYAALEMARQIEPGKWLICMESHEGLFRAAFEVMDLSPLLSRPGVNFFVGRDWILFQSWLRALMGKANVLTMSIVNYPPCARLFPEFYSDASKEIESAVNHYLVQLNTVIQLAKDVERNSLRSITTAARSCGVKALKGAFKELPAIVIGAGPSLTDTVPHLRAAQGKAVLIAVDRALKPLLAAGIVPQFVLSIDMEPVLEKLYEGLDIPPEVVLLYDPDCYYQVPAKYKGRRVIYDSMSDVNVWSRQFLGDHGILAKNLSVGHSAYYLALHMECQPIILVGVDNAFPAEATHAKGVVQVDGGKTDEMKWSWVSVPGVKDVPVRTNSAFAAFITGFEVAIARMGGKVIQTSQIGARIRGTEELAFDRVLERYLTRDYPVADTLTSVLVEPPKLDLEKFASESDRVVTSLSRIAQLCDEGMERIQATRKIDHQNKLEVEKFNKYFDKLSSLRVEVLKEELAQALMSRLLVKTAHRMQVLKLDTEAFDPGHPDRIKGALDQTELFFRGEKDSALFFRGNLQAVRDELLGPAKGVDARGAGPV